MEGQCVLWGICAIVPNKLQACILQELHQDHPGTCSYLWNEDPSKELHVVAKAGQRHRSPCKVQQASSCPASPMGMAIQAWQRVHIHFTTISRKKYFTVVDAHSEWPGVYETSSSTVPKTIALLRHMFAAYGPVSDSGPQFTSGDFTEFIHNNGIKHITEVHHTTLPRMEQVRGSSKPSSMQ